jgi:ABC-type antimicrobial peptide transport system permease subunit
MLFAALGLLLGSVGVYGVVSYAVRRRRVEFGIRMALGAGPGRMLGAALRIGLVPVSLGVVGGAGTALALSGLLRRFLYEVPPDDPVAFAAASCTLLLMGLAASLIPSLRASRAHPAEVLRTE